MKHFQALVPRAPQLTKIFNAWGRCGDVVRSQRDEDLVQLASQSSEPPDVAQVIERGLEICWLVNAKPDGGSDRRWEANGGWAGPCVTQHCQSFSPKQKSRQHDRDEVPDSRMPNGWMTQDDEMLESCTTL